MKCQYTYRETTGSDTYWICPQPDINIISANTSKDLKKALAFRSKLKGTGHAAQHSCFKQAACKTSTNADLGQIMQTSGNEDEDECLGVGLFSTRVIKKGEQIYTSYSGDDKISKVWETVFDCQCYCCQCSGTCCTQTSLEGVQEVDSTTPAVPTQRNSMMETDKPPPDQMDTETNISGPDQAEEGHLLTHTDDTVSVERYPMRTSASSTNAQQITCKRQRGLPDLGTSLTTPKTRVSAIIHQHYVSEAMQILCQPRSSFST